MQLSISVRVIGLIMGFGAGVLISAVAFDLVEDSFDLADGGGVVAVGLLAGCVTFSAGNYLIGKMGGVAAEGPHRASCRATAKARAGGALAIVLGPCSTAFPSRWSSG